MTVWTQAHGWRMSSCERFPTLCRLLMPHLPLTQLPMLTGSQFELEVFCVRPGAHLQVHYDGPYVRLCALICIDGCTGSAWMRVKHEHGWQTYPPACPSAHRPPAVFQEGIWA